MFGVRRALEKIREGLPAFQWCESLLPMDSDVAPAMAGAWDWPPIRFNHFRTMYTFDAWRDGCLFTSQFTDIRQRPKRQEPTPRGDAPTPIPEDQAIQRLIELCTREGLYPTQVVVMHPWEYKLSVFGIPAISGTESAPDGDYQLEAACDQ